MANPFEQMPASAGSFGEAMPGAPSPESGKKEGEEVMKKIFETRRGERFTIERLTSPEDPRVKEVQEMLARRFGKAEVDPIEVMKEAMTGRMATGEECPRYLVNVVQDEKGKVVALATGAAVELVDNNGNQSKSEALLLDAYTVVSEALKKKGVDKHLFDLREKAAIQDAHERGLRVVAYAVEDPGGEEDFYNRHGARRCYTETKDGRLVEVPYIQPPVDWDKRTGKPAEDAGSVPEHLMVKLGFDRELSGERLMEIVRAIYLYNNYREEEYFASKKAVRAHEDFVGAIEEKLKEFLAGRTVRLLSGKEREELQAKGVTFVEHRTEEDKQKEKALPVPRKSSYQFAGGPARRMGESKREARAVSVAKSEGGREREGATMAEKDFQNPEGYWVYEGAFRVELTPDASTEGMPANAVLRKGEILEVSLGRVTQAMGGIQFYGRDKYGEEQPFRFLYRHIKAIRKDNGEPIWLNDDYR